MPKNKGTITKNSKTVKPVEGFGNIQYNIPEDVAMSKKVNEKDVFDKKKKVSPKGQWKKK